VLFWQKQILRRGHDVREPPNGRKLIGGRAVRWSAWLGASGWIARDAIKLVEVEKVVPMNGSLNTVNDDDEKDVGSACADMDEVEAVVAGAINALNELVPYLESA
jgi:hypothetical protein